MIFWPAYELLEQRYGRNVRNPMKFPDRNFWFFSFAEVRLSFVMSTFLSISPPTWCVGGPKFYNKADSWCRITWPSKFYTKILYFFWNKVWNLPPYILRKCTVKTTSPELHRYKIINNIPSKELLFSWLANILYLFLVYFLWLYFLALGSFSEIFKNFSKINFSKKKYIWKSFRKNKFQFIFPD